MKFVAFDLGSKTLGLAVSDKSESFSLSRPTIFYSNYDFDELFVSLDEFMKEEKPEIIILGIPYNMDGSMSTHGKKVIEFKELLTKYKLEIILSDERLTSRIANSYLENGNVSKHKRKKVIDGIAASIILQGHLDKINRGK
ncbi:MAG: Holliday junction resolvase RuvX [Bacilli bacterium]